MTKTEIRHSLQNIRSRLALCLFQIDNDDYQYGDKEKLAREISVLVDDVHNIIVRSR